jgi:biopolymer transport protein ExbB/TolQ
MSQLLGLPGTVLGMVEAFKPKYGTWNGRMKRGMEGTDGT